MGNNDQYRHILTEHWINFNCRMWHYINKVFVKKSTTWLISVLYKSFSLQLKTQKTCKPVT